MLDDIIENRLIETLAGRFARSPQQLNSRHESDAELVRLSENCTLAITTDSIEEEITCGLYADPYLAGWMTVMVNMSDLAAVGAKPVGIVISEILSESCTEQFLSQLHAGIRMACEACDTFVLGGDTNKGAQLSLTGAAVGLCPDSEFLSRIGCKPGDVLCATNHLGSGNAFAALSLLSAFFSTDKRLEGQIPPAYRPRARVKEGQMLRHAATSCMDTSDGVIATLDQLMRLNRVGFALNSNWHESLDPWSLRVARNAQIPEWLLLAGQHGEFELLFTIPPDRMLEFGPSAGVNAFRPVVLGKVISEPVITMPLYGRPVQLDTKRIRNLAIQTDADPKNYLQELLQIDLEVKGAV